MQHPERARAWHEEWWREQVVPRDERARTWDVRGPDMKMARTILQQPTDRYAYRLGEEDIADMNAWQEDYESGREIIRWVWDEERG